jgi:GH18 family chitinase
MSALGFMSALATEKSRAELLNEIVFLVTKFKFSGVAFHWIYPGCPQVNLFYCCCKNDKELLPISLIASSKRTETELQDLPTKCFVRCERWG